MDAHTQLEAALQQAAQDPARRPAFFRLLLESEVFVCAVPGAPAGDEQEQSLSLRIWNDESGAPRLPFFTRLELLQSVIHEQNDAVSISTRALFEMTAGATLFLNPGEDFGKEFSPAEIAALLETGVNRPLSEVHMPPGSQVLLGQPAELPQAMLEALKRFLPAFPGVKAAYLALMHDPSTQAQPGLLIGMQIDGDYQTVLREAGTLIADTAPDGIIVDVLMIKAGEGGISDYMLREVSPFYKRGWKQSLRNLLPA